MSLQFPARIGESIPWLDFLTFWIYTSATLEEKLEDKVLNIFNALSIVRGTYNGSYVSIVWDGTSKSVYHGARQFNIAGKQTIIDTWEIPLRKGNIIESEIDQPILWGYVLNSTLDVKMIGKFQSALTLSGVQVNPLTATLMSDGDTISVFLELPRHPLE